MDRTLYRRPLPAGTIAFSSSEGRALFAEALASGGLDGYFPLAEQFHTQADPAFCGLGSLVVALNALGIDPGRLWKGPWRWFAEDLLDCCVPLDVVRQRGLDLDQLGCLARCNGAAVESFRPSSAELAAFRSAIDAASSGGSVVIAAYDRKELGQTGSGHFSPLGGFHRARDLVLVLDVARFKYPPHWVPVERLFRAMQPEDPATGKPRGWLVLRPRSHGIALGFSLRCEGESWHGLAERFRAVQGELGAAADLAGLCRLIAPLAAFVELRTPSAEAHRDALGSARAALRRLELFACAREVAGEERAEAVSLLVLAAAAHLPERLQQRIAGSLQALASEDAAAAELDALRAQLSAIARVEQ